MLDFNSIKVQLEQDRVRNTASIKLFQFHKGTIRTLYLKKGYNIYIDFNSIKVQLELVNGIKLFCVDDISIP